MVSKIFCDGCGKEIEERFYFGLKVEGHKKVYFGKNYDFCLVCTKKFAKLLKNDSLKGELEKLK